MKAILISVAAGMVLAALAVYTFATEPAAHADSTFTPETTLKFCNAIPADWETQTGLDVGTPNPDCTENLATSAVSDYTVALTMTGDELNFSSVMTFAPNGQTVSDVTTGTLVGALRSLTTLGVANGPCSNTLTIDYALYDVALPNNLGDPAASTNLAYPRVEGAPDRFGGWSIGSAPAAGAGTSPGTGRATGASIAIQNYPAYLLTLFDNRVPDAVYGGLNQVSGTWVPLYFVQFGAGDLIGLIDPLGLADADMGQPSVSVLGDPTSSEASPSTITDFCTPLSVTTMLLGSTAGGTRSTNPSSAGTHFVVQRADSQRDLDQDGWENPLDSCAKTPNGPVGPTAMPRATGAGGGIDGTDADSDGIAVACDPDDASFNNNYDSPPEGTPGGAGFLNRQDNCPLTSNVLQTDSESFTQQDDSGPTDNIGDACDTGSVTISQNGQPVTINLSTSVANGRYHSVTRVIPKCFGNTDTDGDGYCDAQDPGPAVSNVVRHAAWSGATHPGLQTDQDGDFVSDAMETYLGTDATKPCAQTVVGAGGAGNDESPLDNWPRDFNDDGLAALADLILILPLGDDVSVHAKGTRADLNNDGIIALADLILVVPAFGHRCGTMGANADLGIPDWSQQ